MNDDPFLDLFALDLPDLTYCIPDPCDAIELPPCLPVAGGAPGWWDDLWDFLGDIWGGAGDLAEKIGKSFSALWDKAWAWIGGSVRWLYNQFRDVLGWIWDKVVDIGDTVYDILHRFVYWLIPKLTDVWDMATRGIPTALGWIWDKVVDIGDTVYDILHRFITWLIPKLTDVWDMATRGIPAALGWIWDKVVDIGDTVYDILQRLAHAIPDTLRDIGDTVYDILQRLAHAIPDTLTGIWDFVRIDLWGHISGAAAGIGDAVSDAFDRIRKALEDALHAIGKLIADAIRWPWEHIGEGIADDIKTKIAIPMKLFRHQYTRLEDILNDALDPGPLALAGIFALAVLVMGFMAAFSSSWRSYVEPLFEPELQGQRSSVGAELLTVGVVQQALNRGFIDPDTADHHLSYAGYGPNAKKAILELRRIIPSPTDLIRMAVREVFNPDLRRELTLDAEFPIPFGEWADKLGIDETWAANYWAAHWDLPSPGQGYEMLHRGQIEMPQLVDLIKALDYAPVWRDKLIAIAYNPITRVDLRRLYKNKIITEEEVFKGYKALGYDDEKAGWLRDFTKQFYSPDDKSQLDDMADMAATTFRTAYRRGVITRDEALDKIVDAGYTEEVADFLLSIDDAQLALNPLTDAGIPVRDLTTPVFLKAYREHIWEPERTRQELADMGYLAWEVDLLLQLEDLATQSELSDLAETVIKAQYVARAIERTAASAQLDQLKVLPARRDLLLQRWDLQLSVKTRALTVAQLQQAYRADLINDTELLNRLSGMGYNDQDAKTIVDLTDTTPEGKAKRLSAAQLQQAYKIGAITDAKLTEQLLALGYTEEDAKLLVDMATPAPAAKERQLSAGQLTTGFRAGLVTEAELLEKLVALGYAQADAELIRDIAAQRPEPAARKLSVAQLTVGFRAGLVTEAELLEKLAALGYPQADVELIRDIAALQPEPAARKLSVAQLKELFKAETIDKAGLLAELLGLGYTDRDAGWIADLIAPEE